MYQILMFVFNLLMYIVGLTSITKHFSKLLLSIFVSLDKNLSLIICKLFATILIMILFTIFTLPEKVNYLSILLCFLLCLYICYFLGTGLVPPYSNIDNMKPIKFDELGELIGTSVYMMESIPFFIPIRYTIKEPHKMMTVNKLMISI